MSDTDKAWEQWGSSNPYYGVLTSPEYLSSNLDEAARRRFFASGEAHIDHVLQNIKTHLNAGFTPDTALDFGCGVGRLVLALAPRCRSVTGLDVSPAMLVEAEKNCRSAGVENVSLVRSDDALSALTGNFDLIHSHLVLQHIRPRRGLRIIDRLLRHLEPGGVIVLQFPYRCRAPVWIRMLVKLRHLLPPVNLLRNLYRGVPLRQPAMEMNVYRLDSVVPLLERNNICRIFLELHSVSEFDSVLLYARKTRETS